MRRERKLHISDKQMASQRKKKSNLIWKADGNEMKILKSATAHFASKTFFISNEPKEVAKSATAALRAEEKWNAVIRSILGDIVKLGWRDNGLICRAEVSVGGQLNYCEKFNKKFEAINWGQQEAKGSFTHLLCVGACSWVGQRKFNWVKCT